jgi:transcriptional regulator with XRE-family HTH domain
LRKQPFDFEPETLGERILKKRLELGLTQAQVGKLLGVTSFTVLNWEKGKCEPRGKFLLGIKSFLHVSL